MTHWQQHIERWSTHIQFERRLSLNTVAGYLSDVEAFAGWVAEGFPCAEVEDIGREHIEAYIEVLARERNVKVSSQARALSALKSFFRYLVISDIIPQSPCLKISSPKESRHLPDVLTTAEIDLAISTFDLASPSGHRNKAIFEVLYSCGLRVSELTALTLGDIFFDERIVRVVGKGDKQRLVPMSSEAIRQLRLYLECRPQPQRAARNHLFLNQKGGRLSRMSVFSIVKDAVAAAGINKNVSPHTLRHSCATHLLEGGASIRQVQDMLGHESVTTTEIYTHISRRQLHRTIEEFLPVENK